MEREVYGVGVAVSSTKARKRGIQEIAARTPHSTNAREAETQIPGCHTGATSPSVEDDLC